MCKINFDGYTFGRPTLTIPEHSYVVIKHFVLFQEKCLFQTFLYSLDLFAILNNIPFHNKTWEFCYNENKELTIALRRFCFMMYLLAILLPPVAVLFSGKPFQAFFNLILTLFFWLPGAVHAILVVKDKKDDERMQRYIRAKRD